MRKFRVRISIVLECGDGKCTNGPGEEKVMRSSVDRGVAEILLQRMSWNVIRLKIK